MEKFSQILQNSSKEEILEEIENRLKNSDEKEFWKEKVYVQKETLIKNQPEYEVCNPANVIIDPTCDGDLSKATFVAHEYNTSLAELKKDEYVKTIEKYEETNLETGEKVVIEKVTESGFYKNLDSIDIDAVEFVNDEYGSEAANTFRHKDKARRKIRASEIS